LLIVVVVVVVVVVVDVIEDFYIELIGSI